MFFMGVMIMPGNVLKTVEMRGPPTFEDWLAHITVLKVALVMLEAVEPGTFDLYIDRVRQYAQRYDKKAWGLLYQTETRMRHEHFVRIYRKAMAREKAKKKEDEESDDFDVPAFDKDKPWEHIFYVAAECSHKYWFENFVEIAVIFKVDDTALDREMGTDAPIESRGRKRSISRARRDRSPPRTRNTRSTRGRDDGPPSKRARQSGGSRAHNVDENGNYITNRQQVELCKGFNLGKCPLDKKNIRCPEDQRRVHQCWKCLGIDHCALKCPRKDDKEIEVPNSVKKQEFRRQQRGRQGGRR